MKIDNRRKKKNILIITGILLIMIGFTGYAGLIPLASILPQALTSAILTVIGLVLVVIGYFQKSEI